MIEATVFSRPGCIPCASVKEKLEQAGIVYVEVDVFEHPEAIEALERAGYRSVPVVVAAVTFQGDSDEHIQALEAFK